MAGWLQLCAVQGRSQKKQARQLRSNIIISCGRNAPDILPRHYNPVRSCSPFAELKCGVNKSPLPAVVGSASTVLIRLAGFRVFSLHLFFNALLLLQTQGHGWGRPPHRQGVLSPRRDRISSRFRFLSGYLLFCDCRAWKSSSTP